MELFGWLAARNLNIDCLGVTEDLGECKQYNHLLNKFPGDRVYMSDEFGVCFMDGYIVNKDVFTDAMPDDDWERAFTASIRNDTKVHLKKLRGGFCGYLYEKQTENLTLYTDHVSNRAVYYYYTKESWLVSNCLDFMVRVLKANQIEYHFNPLAAKYMLTYGYMLDDSTFIQEIHRLMPGQYVQVTNGEARITRYYFINNKEMQMSEQDAVEKIDAAFREAVRREFEKDREYGYRHLVDLSGGLDSRMVSWVAHDMGYTDQLNITYSQSGYLDDKISREIAGSLKHEYLFKALDDAQWLYDVQEIISRNNGAALYSGITGGNRLLSALDASGFGIEHTGMIGDAILSTFYHDREFNYGKPRLGLHRYSERLSYEFDDEITREYPCQEMFAIYTRGILGAQSSYMIRQHYVETASPFMDVDFLDTVFSVPFEYRKGHHIYLKWMKEKYPDAANFGWEKWGGIQPKESHIFFRRVKTAQRLLWQAGCKILKRTNKDSMNPIDYWYWQDEGIQQYYQTYYKKHINSDVLSEAIKGDISEMFNQRNVTEKSMALTVLAAAAQYFG